MAKEILLFDDNHKPKLAKIRKRREPFNPFAKNSRGRITRDKIRKDTSPSSSLSIINHLCAIRARECWSLWNDDYPVARIIDHYPIENNYRIVLDKEYKYHWNLRNNARKIPVIAEIKITANDLLIFLIDLLRLEQKRLMGNYDLGVTEYKFGFGCKTPNHRFILIPNLSDIADNTVVETDFLGLAKLACSIYMPQNASFYSGCESIKSILNSLDGVEMRSGKKDNQGNWIIGQGTLNIDIKQTPIKLLLDINGTQYNLIANPHGYWVWIPAKTKIRGVGLRINLESEIDVNANNALLYRGLSWQQQPKLWLDGRYNNTIRNLVGTLAAENIHAQNSCYRYNLVESDLKKRTATLNVERLDGNANAHDLWEQGIRNKEIEVAVNSSTDVFEWSHSDVWQLQQIYENEPFKLTIKSLADTQKLQDSGFLKLASIPQRALMSRKNNFIKTAINKRSIIELMKLTFSDMSKTDWRLSKKSNIMALQGPPGTGKTWTACQIIKDILNKNPAARILVSSKEHLALDELSKRIRDEIDDCFDIVRINNNDYATEMDVDPRVLPESIAEKVLDGITLSKSTMTEVGKIATWVENLALRTASVVCTTTLDKTMENLQASGECFDFAIIEEAGKSYPSELIGPISIAMETLLIGDHMQLPPFELFEIKNNIETAINRGIEKWSDKSYRDNFERFFVEIVSKKSNVEKINISEVTKQVEEWLQPFQLIHNSTDGDILPYQWRMFRELSNSVGRIFYEEPFQIKKHDKIRQDELPGIFGEYGQRLIMIDVNDNAESTKNKSYCNIGEAKIAAEHLKLLLDLKQNAIAITPYKGQVDQIRSILPVNYRNKVNTVDGYQGKEADFIILSLVRNNKRTGSSRRWGFFRDPRRINVALSRAREGLLVISSVEQIKNTDWSEGEGQLSKFVDSVIESGQIVTGGSENE